VVGSNVTKKSTTWCAKAVWPAPATIVRSRFLYHVPVRCLPRHSTACVKRGKPSVLVPLKGVDGQMDTFRRL